MHMLTEILMSLSTGVFCFVQVVAKLFLSSDDKDKYHKYWLMSRMHKKITISLGTVNCAINNGLVMTWKMPLSKWSWKEKTILKRISSHNNYTAWHKSDEIVPVIPEMLLKQNKNTDMLLLNMISTQTLSKKPKTNKKSNNPKQKENNQKQNKKRPPLKKKKPKKPPTPKSK